jgi:hypothetical protein
MRNMRARQIKGAERYPERIQDQIYIEIVAMTPPTQRSIGQWFLLQITINPLAV